MSVSNIQLELSLSGSQTWGKTANCGDDSLDTHQGFADLGIDSLTSVELRNQLQSSLGCTLPSTLAFDYPTVAKLTDYLTEKLLQNSSFDLKESNADIDPTVAQMQQLTEAEAEALLLDELENLLK